MVDEQKGLWIAVRRGLLLICKAIEKRYKLKGKEG